MSSISLLMGHNISWKWVMEGIKMCQKDEICVPLRLIGLPSLPEPSVEKMTPIQIQRAFCEMIIKKQPIGSTYFTYVLSKVIMCLKLPLYSSCR